MSTRPSLYVAPEFVDEAQKATSRLFTVPDRAVTRRNKKYWMEYLQIKSSTIEPWEDHPGCHVVFVEFVVPPHSPFEENKDRSHTARFYLDMSTMGGPKSKAKTMTLMSIGRLNELLRCIGFDVSGQGVEYADYFWGDAAPVLGGQCYGNFKAYKDDDNIDRQDITQYISVDDAEATS